MLSWVVAARASLSASTFYCASFIDCVPEIKGNFREADVFLQTFIWSGLEKLQTQPVSAVLIDSPRFPRTFPQISLNFPF